MSNKTKTTAAWAGDPDLDTSALTREERSELKDNLEAIRRELRDNLEAIRRELREALAEALEEATRRAVLVARYNRRADAKRVADEKLRASNSEFIAQLGREHTDLALKLIHGNPNLDEEGTWEIFGANSESKMDSAPTYPFLGIVKGTYRNACLYAVKLEKFSRWGECGAIVRHMGTEKIVEV